MIVTSIAGFGVLPASRIVCHSKNLFTDMIWNVFLVFMRGELEDFY